MSSTVTALALNPANGELTIEQSIPMLPEHGRWAEPLHAPDFAAAGSSEELVASLEGRLEALLVTGLYSRSLKLDPP